MAAPEPDTSTGVAQPDGRIGAPMPPIEDLALGMASLIAEGLWRIGGLGVALGTRVFVTVVTVVRSLSPQAATHQADAWLLSVAERGRAVREEHVESVATSLTAAVTAAATSDAARALSVAALEETGADLLDVMIPRMLQAVTATEMQDTLDELMHGLLVRQLPAALEKTLPTVVLRTATRPASLVPFLGSVLPRSS